MYCGPLTTFVGWHSKKINYNKLKRLRFAVKENLFTLNKPIEMYVLHKHSLIYSECYWM